MPGEDKKEEKKVEEKKEEKKEEVKKTSVDSLTPEQTRQALQYVLNQNKTFAAELNEMKGRLSAKDKKDPAQKSTEDSGDDLETMSRAQFAKHLLEIVSKDLIKPQVDRVIAREQEDESRNVRREIKEFEKEHKDFWTYSEEVKAILGKHPELNIEEAYVLAKHNVPDKVKGLDEAAIEAKKREDAKKAEERRQSFGGLLPTSGKATKNKAMNVKDAAEQAWQDLGMSEHLAAIATE